MDAVGLQIGRDYAEAWPRVTSDNGESIHAIHWHGRTNPCQHKAGKEKKPSTRLGQFIDRAVESTLFRTEQLRPVQLPLS